MRFIKRNKLILIGLIYLVIASCIPFLVNLFYSNQAPFKIFESKMNASATLTYIGAVLTGFGTLCLSLITYGITRRETIKNSYRPFFAIKDINDAKFEKNKYKIYKGDKNDESTYITLINIGTGTAFNVYIVNTSIKDKNILNRLIDVYDSGYEKRTCDYVEKEEIIKFEVKLDDIDKEYEIVYTNTLGYTYCQHIEYRSDNVYAIIILDIKEDGIGILGIDY